MSMNFLLADGISRIRNAQMAKHSYAILKSSKYVASVLEVLKDEGYIANYEEFSQKEGINYIKVDLKYYRNAPVIENVSVISKPGKRLYKRASELAHINKGLGLVLISTSKGVMPDYKAIEANLGGELICKIN